MAYTIVSQNNTTTTLADELGNVIHVPARVTLATSTEYTVTKVNNNTATLEDGDGNIIRDVPCVAVLYGGDSGGGDHPVTSVNGKTGVVVLDAKDVSAIPQYETMPPATADNHGDYVQFIGSSGTYTNGYFYVNKSSQSYTDSVTFDPATISGTTVTATAGALAGLCEEYGSGNITDIIKGSLTYDESGGLLVFVGLDDTDTQVCTFQLYTQDYEDAGFTFTGTLQDGDVIAFTCTITEVTSYAWERIDVQPAQVNADWNANSGVAQILNKPTLATVATTGSYSDLSNTPTIPDAIQVDTMPTAAVGELGKVYQFIGTTDANYTHGYFYECVSDGQTPATYSWTRIDVQPGGGGSTAATGTLVAADWSSSSQTINVTGVTASNNVIVAPAPASQADYTSAGIICTAQGAGTLTFTCTSTPSSDLTVNVLII